MSVYRRGKHWYIDIYLGSVRFRRKTLGTKKEAEAHAADLLKRHNLKQLTVEQLTDPEVFDFAASQYLNYCKTTKSARTYELEQTDYDIHLKSIFSTYFLSDISTEALQQYQSAKKSSGFANRTINIHIGLVRKIMNYAKDHNMVQDIKIKYPMLPESQKQHAFLTPDELKALLDNLGQGMSPKRVRFGLATGLRPGELAYLSWEDVDLEMGIIRIVSKPPLWIIKTKQERTVPLNKTALAILQGLDMKKKGPWVFSNTEKPVKSVKKALAAAAEKAGIKKKVTPNMMRHTFATLALMKGADVKSVMEIMGHTDIATTQKYLHAIKEKLRTTVELLDEEAMD
jgi:site-specific recombinase XerD